jgi:hypothetical protein
MVGGPVTRAQESSGCGHPLVRALEVRMAVAQQIGVAALILVLALGGLALGVPGALEVTLGAGAVVGALAALIVGLLLAERRRAIEVILAGEALALEAVERERRRLGSPEAQASLARAYEWVLNAGPAPLAFGRAARPWLDPRLVEACAPQVRRVIARLRSGGAAVRGVALGERLISDGLGVLYGHDETALRAELDRVLFLMDTPEPPLP